MQVPLQSLAHECWRHWRPLRQPQRLPAYRSPRRYRAARSGAVRKASAGGPSASAVARAATIGQIGWRGGAASLMLLLLLPIHCCPRAHYCCNDDLAVVAATVQPLTKRWLPKIEEGRSWRRRWRGCGRPSAVGISGRGREAPIQLVRRRYRWRTMLRRVGENPLAHFQQQTISCFASEGAVAESDTDNC